MVVIGQQSTVAPLCDKLCVLLKRGWSVVDTEFQLLRWHSWSRSHVGCHGSAPGGRYRNALSVLAYNAASFRGQGVTTEGCETEQCLLCGVHRSLSTVS